LLCLAACAVLALVGSADTTSVLAQSGVDVCLRSGMSVRAVRIEPSEGRFKLYFDAASPPLDVGAGDIQSIGQPCAPANANRNPAQPTAAPATDAGTQSSSTPSFGIHGSNTIGERLMPMLIDAYADKRFGAKPVYNASAPEQLDIDIRGPGSGLGSAPGSGSGSAPVVRIDLQAKGSGTAVRALLSKAAAIGMASRRALPQEADQVTTAAHLNLLGAGNEHVLALDGLAVIVNHDNPIRRLTLPTIARIFSGEVRNWSQVTGRDADGREISGNDVPIVLHARDNKSGTFDTFVSLVLSTIAKPLAPDAKRYESSELLSDAVDADRGAIGFIGLPYVNKNHALVIQSDCGLFSSPTRYTVKTEEYPLARRLYLYTLGAPPQPIARELLGFALSDQAQPTIAEAGFIDQTIEIEDASEQARYVADLVAKPDAALGKSVPADAVDNLSRLLKQLHRTSAVFRFERNGTDLDIRALQDVDRLATFLHAGERTGKRFVIAGFADANGTWQANLALSAARAQRVAAELRRQGVSVPDADVIPFSYFAPVACNDSDAGRAKNRRVEIWVTQ
jgi:phosphate transport system substrate-binding protein